MGLAVLARVTAVFWCFACVIWILYGLIQNNKQNGKNAIEIIKYVLAAGVPYVVFGLIQMWYIMQDLVVFLILEFNIH